MDYNEWTRLRSRYKQVAMMIRLACSWLVVFVPGTVLSAGPPPVSPEEVFGLDRVWNLHLTISPEQWQKMQPARGGFNRSKADAPSLSEDRKPRGGFGYDFEYVQADLEIDGTILKNVGVRYKGNSTFMVTSSYLKKPFKIDLDRDNPDQSWGGLRKLTLNNNVMDPSATREPLAYAVYRAAGIPAPRTAFARVTLTVPGKHDRTLVGLYTLIETIDKSFLEDHFGSGKGMLLKPENIGPAAYLGEDWANYEARYRPKSEPSKKARQRLIDFTRLIDQADDKKFQEQIGAFLDVDRFLRYLAATVLLSSMDSFVGIGHNYYLYLDPKTNRFVVLPWDLDHSFGALTMFGSAKDLFDLSIRKPYPGRNVLVERILSDKSHFETYRGHMNRLLETFFQDSAMKQRAAAIRKIVSPLREQEKQAISKRGESWNSWNLLFSFNPPPDVETFITKRIPSLKDQLAGKSQGTVLRSRGPGPVAGRGMERSLVQPVLSAADNDKDGKLSREELAAGTWWLFTACAGNDASNLPQKTLTASLEKWIPRSNVRRGPPQPGPVLPSAAIMASKGIIRLAGEDGSLSLESLLAASERLFDQSDRNRDGMLDSTELTEAIKTVLTPPPAPMEVTQKK
ncbi:MAG: CotH kinase family protein [Gemmataceae bacterium]